MDKLSTQRQAFHGCLSSMYDVRTRAWGFQRDFLLLEQRADYRNDLRICAGRHVGNPRKENPQKQKPRDFGKSNVPLNVKTSAPQQEPSLRRAEDYLELHTDQAIGRIVSAQANFMRVIVINSGTTAMENEVAVDNGCDTCSDDKNASAFEVPFATAESLGAKEKLGSELLCVVRALLKKIKRRVMVGDKVLVSGIDWVDGRGMIEEVFDRETEILDPPVANVDHLIVLAALDRPRPEPFSLSRFLVEAESTRIPFTVVFNKVDLVSSEDVSDWESRLTSWGYKPLFCSAMLKLGIDSLVELLANKTSAIIGLSGVGKSSVINALCDETGAKLWNSNSKVEPDVVKETGVESWDGIFEEQAVGEVSERTGRGKHTTRHVSLLKLPSAGYLADTPGFNQPNLAKVTARILPFLFPEIRSKLDEGICAFADCLHIGEPDCVVGGDWERYGHYIQFLEEVKKREELEIKTYGTKKKIGMRYKVGASGMKQAEPLLNLKKHRRVSRNKEKQNLAEVFAEEVQAASEEE